MDKKKQRRMMLTSTVIFALVVALVVVALLFAMGGQNGVSRLESASGTALGHGAMAESGFSTEHDIAFGPSCAFDFLLGLGADAAVEQITALDRPYRVIGPDSIVTHEFNPERINLVTNGDGIIETVHCG